jgi:hypothetical protein
VAHTDLLHHRPEATHNLVSMNPRSHQKNLWLMTSRSLSGRSMAPAARPPT